MHAHQHGFVGLPFTFDQGDVFQVIALLAEGNQAEVAVSRRHIHLFAALYEAFAAQSVRNQIFYRDNVQSVLLGKGYELRHTCHGAVLVEYFDEAGSRLHTGEPGQVNGGFGVAGAGQYAAVLGVEGVDVSRAAETFGAHVGIGQGADGSGAVMAADACGATFQQVDGHGERSAQHTRVGLYLVLQSQLSAALVGNRGAEHAASVVQHEVHGFGRDQFGSHNQVALVLAVLIVHDNDKLSVFEVLYCLFDRGCLEGFHICWG